MNEAVLGLFGDKRREDLGAVLLDAVESKRTLSSTDWPRTAIRPFGSTTSSPTRR